MYVNLYMPQAVASTQSRWGDGVMETCWMRVEPVRQRSLLHFFREGCVAQVLPARGQLFGIHASRKQRGSLLLGHARRNHHTVARLGGDGGGGVSGGREQTHAQSEKKKHVYLCSQRLK